MLKVKILAEGAKLPTVVHPQEDLGYDVYALEDTSLPAGGQAIKVRTGIAVAAYKEPFPRKGLDLNLPLGLLVRDRSSMASKSVYTHGGVLDAGYRGEILVLMSYHGLEPSFPIKAGDKIAQMVPVEIWTGAILQVEELELTSRGDKGFGSSGT